MNSCSLSARAPRRLDPRTLGKIHNTFSCACDNQAMSVSGLGCDHCGSSDLKPHCEHRDCGWVRCQVCAHITGLVAGKPRSIAGR